MIEPSANVLDRAIDCLALSAAGLRRLNCRRGLTADLLIAMAILFSSSLMKSANFQIFGCAETRKLLKNLL